MIYLFVFYLVVCLSSTPQRYIVKLVPINNTCNKAMSFLLIKPHKYVLIIMCCLDQHAPPGFSVCTRFVVPADEWQQSTFMEIQMFLLWSIISSSITKHFCHINACWRFKINKWRKKHQTDYDVIWETSGTTCKQGEGPSQYAEDKGKRDVRRRRGGGNGMK